jgi:Fe-S-cluster containining protein
MTVEEYVKLALAIGNDKVQESGPVLILGGWQFSTETCPGLTDTGCILDYPDRPEACRIYPFVKVPTINGDQLFLDTSRCKSWHLFGHFYDKAKEEINSCQKG